MFEAGMCCVPDNFMEDYAAACARKEPFIAIFGTLWRSLTKDQGLSISHISGSICFSAETLVMLSDGSYQPITAVDVGTQLAGGRVAATWKQHLEREHPMANVLGVSITADHPVFLDGAWVLPAHASCPEIPSSSPPR